MCVIDIDGVCNPTHIVIGLMLLLSVCVHTCMSVCVSICVCPYVCLCVCFVCVYFRDATIHNLDVSIYCHLCIMIQRYIARYNQV